jgi:hypothetical protein
VIPAPSAPVSVEEFTARELMRVTLTISIIGAIVIILGGGAIMRLWGLLE